MFLLGACSSVSNDAYWGSTQEPNAPATTTTVVPAPVESSGARKQISIYLGQRNLDEGDWEPVEQQSALGFEFVFENPASIVGFEIGLFGSYKDDTISGIDVEASTGELYAGIRKTFGQAKVHPYLGAGMSVISAELDASLSGVSVNDDDSSLAGYAHGGILFDVSKSIALGVDVRTLFGSDIELFGVSGDADYVQFAFVMAIRL